MRDKVALGIAFLAIAISGLSGFFNYKAAGLQAQTERLLAAKEAAARVDQTDHVGASHTLTPWSGPKAMVQENTQASGIWCTLAPEQYDRMASLYVEKNLGPVIGLNGTKGVKEPGVHDLAFYVLDGKGAMQVKMSNGNYEHVDMEELVKLAIAARPVIAPPRPLPERVVNAGP